MKDKYKNLPSVIALINHTNTRYDYSNVDKDKPVHDEYELAILEERLIIQYELDTLDGYDNILVGNLNDVILELQELRETYKNEECLKIVRDYDIYTEDSNWYLISERKETAKEFSIRMDLIEKVKEDIKEFDEIKEEAKNENEEALYIKLKNKYEGK